MHSERVPMNGKTNIPIQFCQDIVKCTKNVEVQNIIRAKSMFIQN